MFSPYTQKAAAKNLGPGIYSPPAHTVLKKFHSKSMEYLRANQMSSIVLLQWNVLYARTSLFPRNELTVHPQEYLSYYTRNLFYLTFTNRIPYIGPFTQIYQQRLLPRQNWWVCIRNTIAFLLFFPELITPNAILEIWLHCLLNKNENCDSKIQNF